MRTLIQECVLVRQIEQIGTDAREFDQVRLDRKSDGFTFGGFLQSQGTFRLDDIKRPDNDRQHQHGGQPDGQEPT